MKNRSIFYIYAGTQGTAGLYLYPILQSIEKLKIKCYAFTSYYYPFKDSYKYFFKFTDLASGKQKNKLRPYIRYLELCIGLFRVFLKELFIRPEFVNYSLNSSYLPEYLFIFTTSKILRLPLIITCHDVEPFANAYIKDNTEFRRRKKILKLADYLLVHNNHSKEKLISLFKIDSSKIIFHKFPIMDLSLLDDKQISKRIDFLFIGHLRREKGIEILLEAWKNFHSLYPDASLCIAGNMPANNNLNIDCYSNLNINFILEYISDNEYIELIKSSKCIILPYTKGTNSGIPSSALSVNTQVITSNIDMFKENFLINDDSMFENTNIESLLDCMIKKYNSIQSNIDPINTLQDYQKSFEFEIQTLYKKLYKQNN